MNEFQTQAIEDFILKETKKTARIVRMVAGAPEKDLKEYVFHVMKFLGGREKQVSLEEFNTFFRMLFSNRLFPEKLQELVGHNSTFNDLNLAVQAVIQELITDQKLVVSIVNDNGTEYIVQEKIPSYVK